MSSEDQVDPLWRLRWCMLASGLLCLVSLTALHQTSLPDWHWDLFRRRSITDLVSRGASSVPSSARRSWTRCSVLRFRRRAAGG